MADETLKVDGNNNAVGGTLSDAGEIKSVRSTSLGTNFAQNTVVINAAGTNVAKRAIVNVAHSQTDAAVVAAVAGKKIRMLWADVIAGGTATNVTFNTKPAGAGTAITALKACVANGGFTWPVNEYGWCETKAGEGLSVTTGTGSTVGIDVGYIEV